MYIMKSNLQYHNSVDEVCIFSASNVIYTPYNAQDSCYLLMGSALDRQNGVYIPI